MAWREDAIFGQVQATANVDLESTLEVGGAAEFAGAVGLGASATLTSEGGAVDLESEAITIGTGTSDTVIMAGLPTEDPEVAGQLWADSAVVTVSA